MIAPPGRQVLDELTTAAPDVAARWRRHGRIAPPPALYHRHTGTHRHADLLARAFPEPPDAPPVVSGRVARWLGSVPTRPHEESPCPSP